MRATLVFAFLVSCSSSTTPTTTDAASDTGCSTPMPSTQCIHCDADTTSPMECVDGKWKCPSGTSVMCAPSCTGTGPICCDPSGPSSEPSCTGPETWQCPIGTTATPRETGCK